VAKQLRIEQIPETARACSPVFAQRTAVAASELRTDLAKSRNSGRWRPKWSCKLLWSYSEGVTTTLRVVETNLRVMKTELQPVPNLPIGQN